MVGDNWSSLIEMHLRFIQKHLTTEGNLHFFQACVYIAIF